jgi:tetratricopeptide (TPR) repeat protein
VFVISRDMWMAVIAIVVAGCSGAADGLDEALALERAGRDADALGALDALALRSPAWELPRIEAARLRMKLGRELDRAAADLQLALSLAPGNPRAHYLFGVAAEGRGDEEAAMRGYDAALSLRPSYEEARFRLAGIHFARGEWALAEHHYRELAQGSSASSQARLQWIATLEKQGRDDAAEAELVRMREADPRSMLVAHRLAALYERTGRMDLARKIATQADAPERKKMRPLRKSRR